MTKLSRAHTHVGLHEKEKTCNLAIGNIFFYWTVHFYILNGILIGPHPIEIKYYFSVLDGSLYGTHWSNIHLSLAIILDGIHIGPIPAIEICTGYCTFFFFLG